MGLVIRNGRKYFYRSRRVGGRVETEVFSGLLAEAEAAAVEEAREARRREAEAEAEAEAKEDEIDRELDNFFGQVEDFATERLEAAGYYRHKRQWRRRRNRQQDASDSRGGSGD